MSKIKGSKMKNPPKSTENPADFYSFYSFFHEKENRRHLWHGAGGMVIFSGGPESQGLQKKAIFPAPSSAMPWAQIVTFPAPSEAMCRRFSSRICRISSPTPASCCWT